MATKPVSVAMRHTANRTDAVSRIMRSKLDDFISLKDFGCKGDGSDETDRIQAAVNRACNDGVALFIPDGIYGWSQAAQLDVGRTYPRKIAIQVPAGKRLVMFGNGMGRATFKNVALNAGHGGFWLNTGASVFAADFTLDLNADTFNGYARGIDGQGVDIARVENMEVTGASGGILFEATAAGAQSNRMTVRFCWFHDNYNNNVGTKYGGVNIVTVEGCLFESVGNGGAITYEAEEDTFTGDEFAGQLIAVRNTINGCGTDGQSQGSAIIISEGVENVLVAHNNIKDVYGNTGAGISVTSSPVQTDRTVRKAMIEANIIDNARIGVDLDTADAEMKSITVRANQINTPATYGIRIGSALTSDKAGKFTRLIVDDNEINDPGNTGIKSLNALASQLDHPKFRRNTINGSVTNDGMDIRAWRPVLQDITAYGCARRGIYLRGESGTVGSDGAKIKGNTLESNGETGLYVEDSKYAHISGNDIRSNASNGIRLQQSLRAPSDHYFDANYVADNGGYGLSLAVSTNNFVSESNRFCRNGSGAFSGDTASVASADPTAGTFDVGDRYRRTGSPTAVNVGDRLCITGGTAGTLSGVTANTTNGSPSVVVNDASSLEVGQYLTITAAGISGARINAISGTTLTLSANATSDQTATAVAWSAPAFRFGEGPRLNRTFPGDANASPSANPEKAAVIYIAAITADRTVTLPTPSVQGMVYTVTRTAGATGAFNVLVKNSGGTTIATLAAASTWVDVYYDGANWRAIRGSGI